MVGLKFGVFFLRSAWFKLPNELVFNGKKYTLKYNLASKREVEDFFIDIFLDDVYKIEHIKKHDPSIKTIFDVGSHSGFFSLYAKMKCPEARVFAFEPNPKLSDIIQNQARIGSFQYVPAGIGSRAAKAQIVEHPDFSVINRTAYDDTGEIDIIPLSILMAKEHIDVLDILKLDCEGAEWDIFNDSDSFKRIKWLTMEYHLVENHSFEELKNTLNALNFNILNYTIDGDGWGMLLARNRGKI